MFPGFLTPVLTQLFFPKPQNTFPTCFYRGERRKYTRKKSLLNRGSNSQPPGHEFDTLTTEPPGWGPALLRRRDIKILLWTDVSQPVYAPLLGSGGKINKQKSYVVSDLLICNIFK